MAAGRYFFYANMDVEPDKEALLNEIYDTEHVPALLKVPGVISVTRRKAEAFAVSIGGDRREVRIEATPAYSAIYEITGPELLVSDAWAEAVEVGRWPEMIRPYTSNRSQVLRKQIGPGDAD